MTNTRNEEDRKEAITKLNHLKDEALKLYKKYNHRVFPSQRVLFQIAKLKQELSSEAKKEGSHIQEKLDALQLEYQHIFDHPEVIHLKNEIDTVTRQIADGNKKLFGQTFEGSPSFLSYCPR